MLIMMGCRNFAQNLITAFSKKKNLPRYEWTLSSSGILDEKQKYKHAGNDIINEDSTDITC